MRPRPPTPCSACSNFNPRIPYGMRLQRGRNHATARNFNPRIPYGMRPCRTSTTRNCPSFQSTHPVWDATAPLADRVKAIEISIHASRMGCDGRLATQRINSTYFNPRIPYGMRPGLFFLFQLFKRFQSTHPVWDATSACGIRKSCADISIHASRMGCDAGDESRPQVFYLISIHASRMGCDPG